MHAPADASPNTKGPRTILTRGERGKNQGKNSKHNPNSTAGQPTAGAIERNPATLRPLQGQHESAYAQATIKVISGILTRLEITPLEAYALTTERNALKLPEADRAIRHELNVSFIKANIPLIYGESLLEHMMGGNVVV
jgi:hypothetical protein